MLKFHRLCGYGVSLGNNCTTAQRQNPIVTDGINGICFTNTPLVNDEMFEIQVDKIVTRWNPAVSLGVTTNIPSDQLGIYVEPRLKESWILKKSSLYKNREGIGSYSLNLNTVQVGDKLGIMKASDSTLHFYLNGIDHGKAFSNLPEVVYGVVDLDARCCQVSTGNQVVYDVIDLYDSCCQVSIVNQAESTTEAGAQVAIKQTPNVSGRPVDWNVDAVSEFITSIPDCAPYAAKFKSEHIDGAALIELDKKDLKEFFDMPLGLAVKICSHLKKLVEKK